MDCLIKEVDEGSYQVALDFGMQVVWSDGHQSKLPRFDTDEAAVMGHVFAKRVIPEQSAKKPL